MTTFQGLDDDVNIYFVFLMASQTSRAKFEQADLCHMRTIKWMNRETVTRWHTRHDVVAFQLNELSLFSGWLPALCFRFICWIPQKFEIQILIESANSKKSHDTKPKVFNDKSFSFECFHVKIHGTKNKSKWKSFSFANYVMLFLSKKNKIPWKSFVFLAQTLLPKWNSFSR